MLLLLVSLPAKSQIVAEQTPLGNQNVYVMKTSNSVEKYIVFRGPMTFTGSDTVRIYNPDWSLYRQVNLPAGFEFNPLQTTQPISYLVGSDNLFNSDTLIEFLIGRNNYSSNYTVSVVNELGQTVFTFPDSINYGSMMLYKINNTFKVYYNTYLPQSPSIGETKVYSLPGSLPCSQCNFTSGIVEPNYSEGISEMKVYPNPFNNGLEINYDFQTHQDNPRLILTDILGRELKSIPLNNQSDRITLNTSDIPKGTVIVSLLGSAHSVISKKVIKID